MNSWHVPIQRFSAEQLEVLTPIYRKPGSDHKYLCWTEWKTPGWKASPTGKLIFADEAFRKLKLEIPARLQSNIEILKQQLAAKPLDVDWSLISSEYQWLAQNVHSGDVDFYKVKPTGDSYILLATRPKPKYTPEQIKAAEDYANWLYIGSGRSNTFQQWLKEVNNG